MEMLLLLVTGALSGFIAGFVGLAGGIIVVPALTWLYGNGALQDAIVVSWYAVLFNSISAASKQLRIRSAEERLELIAGARYYLLGAALVTPLLALALTGAGRLISPMVVGALQLCLAAAMLCPVSDAPAQRTTRRGRDLSFGALTSALSTLIGVGGGTYTIAYFVYAAKRRFQDAIATANMTGLVIGAFAVCAHLASSLLLAPANAPHSGSISGLGTVILVVCGAAFSPLGVRLSRRFPNKVLRRILVGVLFASAIRLLVS